jgi:hypothetical protein
LVNIHVSLHFFSTKNKPINHIDNSLVKKIISSSKKIKNIDQSKINNQNSYFKKMIKKLGLNSKVDLSYNHAFKNKKDKKTIFSMDNSIFIEEKNFRLNLKNNKIIKKNTAQNINYLNKNQSLEKKKILIKSNSNSHFFHPTNKFSLKNDKKLIKNNNSDFLYIDNNRSTIDYCSSCIHHGID